MIKVYRERPKSVYVVQFTRDTIQDCKYVTEGRLNDIYIPRSPQGEMIGYIVYDNGLRKLVKEFQYIVKNQEMIQIYDEHTFRLKFKEIERDER